MGMIAFRTSETLDRRLSNAAKTEKKTKTDIIREALDAWLDGKAASTRSSLASKRQRSKESLKDFIGIWDGPADASSNTGRNTGEHLLEKHRSRRL